MKEELIKTLAESAGFDIFLDSIYVKNDEGLHRATNEVHRLAELIVTECINACGSDFGTELIKKHFGVEE